MSVAQYLCNHEYHDGKPSDVTAICSCGTFAIGICTDCHSNVCGSHSALGADVARRCGTCHGAHIESAKQATAASADTERQGESAAFTAWLESCIPHLAGYDDWIERLLIAARATEPPKPDDYDPRSQQKHDDSEEVLRLLVPDLYDSEGSPVWTGYEISDYFAARCQKPPNEIQQSRTTVLGRRKKSICQYWGGSWSPDIRWTGSSFEWAAIWIRADGEPLHGISRSPLRESSEPKSRDLFSVWGLRTMAVLLELDELPARPTASRPGWTKRPGPRTSR